MSALVVIDACEDGQLWADAIGDYRKAWEICERGDWMLWIANKANTDIKSLTRAKVGCAKLVEHLMKDKRSIDALRVAEKFAEGNATRCELDAASAAAYASYATAAAAAAYAADADAAAAAAATAAAAAAAYAADAYAAATAAAAAAAAYAADAAAYDRKKILKECADICRKYINFSDIEEYLDIKGAI